MKKSSVVCAALVVAVSAACAASLPNENRFDFQKRMLVVHRADRRDASLKPAADEFVFRTGAGAVKLPAGADEVLRHAAADFADYLKVSMGVKVERWSGGEVEKCGGVEILIDAGVGERTSRIEVGDAGVKIVASDSFAAGQALFHLEDLMNLRRAPFLKKGVETRRMRMRSASRPRWTTRP